jgi:NADPH:quinone reductase
VSGPDDRCRRLVCHGYGTDGAVGLLRVEHAELPIAGHGEVLVRVEAANVSFVDRLLLTGAYQVRPEVPFVPGTALVGAVAAVGDGVDRWEVGDKVAGMVLRYGAFATHAVVPADALCALPAGTAAVQVAVALEAYGTAAFALQRRTSVAAGERVVVLGAGGAVGHATADTARWLGARVAAVTSGPDRVRALLGAGVETLDAAVPLRDQLRAWAPDGVDVVVDTVGGAATEPALRSLAVEGRLLIVGFASGAIPRLPANHVLLRNRSVVGIDWGGWLHAHPAAIGKALTAVAERVATGAVHPFPPHLHALEDLAGVLRDDSHHLRAAVLVPDGT